MRRVFSENLWRGLARRMRSPRYIYILNSIVLSSLSSKLTFGQIVNGFLFFFTVDGKKK